MKAYEGQRPFDNRAFKDTACIPPPAKVVVSIFLLLSLTFGFYALRRKEDNEAITLLCDPETINFTTRAKKCLGNFSGGLPL